MNEVERKKILGQFFSGGRLGRLLVSLLWRSNRFASLVDPMAGIGDLLLAAKSRVKRNGVMVGVEIDTKTASKCRQKIPAAKIVAADAFQAQTSAFAGSTETAALIVSAPEIAFVQLT